MQAAELPPDYPLHHARTSLSRAMDMEGHLLTAGESNVIAQWHSLSPDAAHVHARLYGRKVQPVRLDGFDPPLYTSLDAALTELEQSQMVDRNQTIPSHEQFEVWRLPELRTACRQLDIPSKGSKAALIERLRDCSKMVPTDGIPVVRIRNRSLFQRVHRAYLHDHQGDLNKVVLSEMGLRKSVSYSTTPGTGRFRNRAALIDYERARSVLSEPMCVEDALKKGEEGLETLQALCPPRDTEWRFSGHRFRQLQVQRAAAHLERSKCFSEASTLYANLLTLQPRNPSHIAQRLALCLDRMGEPKAGLQRCLEHQHEGPEGYPLIRTGRRLARRTGIEWMGDELPPNPPEKSIELPYGVDKGKWYTEDGPRRIEDAVVHFLNRKSRKAFRSENQLWSTLYGLIFTNAMFAPIDGMLPSPHLNRPLDLSSKYFRRRRRDLIDRGFEDIAQGKASSRIKQNFKRYTGQNIAGVAWARFSLQQLCSVCELVSPKALTFIMNRFVDDWNSAVKGMPDLVVFPCHSNSLVAGPSHQLLLVELKGPNDSLRDHQRWWHWGLNQHGMPTQVWHIRSAGG